MSTPKAYEAWLRLPSMTPLHRRARQRPRRLSAKPQTQKEMKDGDESA
jgi:hypothetical protein